MRRQDIVKSAGRVIEIFEYFDEKRSPLTVRQVAERFDYPLSSAAALMKSLHGAGYLRYDTKRRSYLPTARLAHIGDWVCDALAYREGLIPLVTGLAEETGLTAILGAENDIYADYIHVVPGDYHIQLNVPQGTRRLLCWSAFGWAILATHTDAAVRDAVVRTRAMLGRPAQSITLSWVMGAVREARMQGYATSRSLLLRDAAVVAMALSATAGVPRLAIGLGGYVKKIDRELPSLVGTLRSAVQKLSAAKSPAKRRSRARLGAY